MKNKLLIILRHAHRSKDLGAETDNGLSKKGREQAQNVSDYFRAKYGGSKPLCLSSPKARCFETLVPLAKKEKVEVTIAPLLNEQHESTKEFEERIQEFCRWWKEDAPEMTVICSHGDWIPLATEELVGTIVNLKKAGWVEIELSGDQVSLSWVLQEVP
jgi:broad specificity phosphatase PhoE